jgi:predicted amidophosphoribosyltransferase
MSLEARLPLGAGGRPAGGAQTGGLRGLARWWRDSVAEPVISVLFPPRCVGCGDFESHLCAHCEASLVPIGEGSCPRCGEPGPRPLVGGRCSHCMGVEMAQAGARSAFLHAGVAKRMVVEFKAGGQPVLAPVMARLAAPAFRGLVSAAGENGPVVVTWVPSHPAAQRERGYNQAELLARALAGGRPPLLAAGLARKPVRTKHQKALGKSGRQGNLRGAFVIDEKALGSLPFCPAALVLVDDVYTTGATAQEVASVLEAGAGSPVYVFTFSRAASGGSEGHD